MPAPFDRGVIVAGAGVSGTGIATLFRGIGVDVLIADDRATGEGIITTEAARAHFGEVGAVVTSPGWRPDSPLLVDAAFASLPVIGDVEACYRLDRAGACLLYTSPSPRDRG